MASNKTKKKVYKYLHIHNATFVKIMFFALCHPTFPKTLRRHRNAENFLFYIPCPIIDGRQHERHTATHDWSKENRTHTALTLFYHHEGYNNKSQARLYVFIYFLITHTDKQTRYRKSGSRTRTYFTVHRCNRCNRQIRRNTICFFFFRIRFLSNPYDTNVRSDCKSRKQCRANTYVRIMMNSIKIPCRMSLTRNNDS